MKKITFLAMASLAWGSVAAQQFMSRAAHVEFFSETPAENIFAETDQASAVLDLASNQLAFQVPIISFHFEKALMEEHFNENYMESERYPAATFQGKINDIDGAAAVGTALDVTATGTLTVHGVGVERTVNGKATRTEAGWTLDAVFDVPTADHDIAIPKLVREKIAERIAVTLHAELAPR